jgi:hypothetical protein
MRKALAPLARRPLFLAILVAILAISLVYSASVRRAYLMGDLQYIPVEDEFLLVTGDLESLWEAVDHHFGPVFLEEERDGEEIGALTGLFRDAREGLADEDLPVESLDDLVGYGFNIEGGALMSLAGLSASRVSPLVVLPVTGEGAITEVFSVMAGAPDDEAPELGLGDVLVVSWGARMARRGPPPRPRAPSGPRTGPTSGVPSEPRARSEPQVPSEPADTSRELSVDWLLAYPGNNRALTTTAPDHLRRAILNRDRNLAHASADDELYAGVRETLQGSLGSGPTVFGLWRPLAEPGIERLTGVLALRPEALRLSVEVKVDAGVLRVLDDFLLPSQTSDDWQRFLDRETAAAVAVEDEALSDHLGFLRRFETIRTFMDDAYGGVLSELVGLPGLHRVVLAVTGYRDGLPELVMGVWGDPDSLRGLVTNVQLRQREERDSAVLMGAAEAFLEEASEETELPDTLNQVSVQVLEEAGILVPEEGSTFRRHTLRTVPGGGSQPRVVVEPATLVPEDLSSAGYVRGEGTDTIRLLLPPVTDNDVAHIPGLAEVDGEVLRGDRYRLATVVLDSVLWVATDVRDAQEQIHRAAADPGEELDDLSENSAFQMARANWSRGDRVQGFLDVERLTNLGLLTPESQVEEAVKLSLLDLRNHPSVSIAVRSNDARERVLIEVAAFLQRRLRDR